MNTFRKMKNYFQRFRKRRFINKLSKKNIAGLNLKVFGTKLPTILNEDNVYLGNNVRLNEGVYLFPYGDSKIRIEDNVTLSPFVRIFTGGYDLQVLLNEKKDEVENNHISGDILIGENCWIGHSTIILPGVKLNGKNIIVGAGSVVTKSFNKSNVLIAGNPATIKKVY
ncbi:MAG: acyltransferase [Bacteroidia bacterium]|nr:acyltransferase [Bacteroidia bacterium]